MLAGLCKPQVLQLLSAGSGGSPGWPTDGEGSLPPSLWLSAADTGQAPGLLPWRERRKGARCKYLNVVRHTEGPTREEQARRGGPKTAVAGKNE